MSQAAAISYGGVKSMSGAKTRTPKARDAMRTARIVVVGPDTYDVVGLTASEALARWDEQRLAEIKRQIAAGTYLTEEKVAIAIDRLCEALQEVVAEREVAAL
jgi:hypothetical protein